MHTGAIIIPPEDTQHHTQAIQCTLWEPNRPTDGTKLLSRHTGEERMRKIEIAAPLHLSREKILLLLLLCAENGV
jgi:hypothetical protein